MKACKDDHLSLSSFIIQFSSYIDVTRFTVKQVLNAQTTHSLVKVLSIY